MNGNDQRDDEWCLSENELLRIWRKVCDEGLGAATMRVKMQGGFLEVCVNDPVYKREIEFLERDGLLRQMNERLSQRMSPRDKGINVVFVDDEAGGSDGGDCDLDLASAAVPRLAPSGCMSPASSHLSDHANDGGIFPGSGIDLVWAHLNRHVLDDYHLYCKRVNKSTKAGYGVFVKHRVVDLAAALAGGKVVHEWMFDEFAYALKGEAVYAEIVVPEGTPTPTREDLWCAVDIAENENDARVAWILEFYLPRKLEENSRTAAALTFAEWWCGEYEVVADVSIHAPARWGRHHYACIMSPLRSWDEQGRLAWKTCDFDDAVAAGEYKKIRVAWETICNYALERGGWPERVCECSEAGPGASINEDAEEIAKERFEPIINRLKAQGFMKGQH